MTDKETCIDIIKSIANFNGIRKNTPVDIIIADELQSVDFIDPLYKILKITKCDYYDYHYKCNGNAYDVFVYNDYDMDVSKLYQLIICNNYTQVIKFNQSNYAARNIVSEFGNPGKVYSFYDGTIIVVEPIKESNVEYEII
jgi:hypothetical protein